MPLDNKDQLWRLLDPKRCSLADEDAFNTPIKITVGRNVWFATWSIA